MSTRAHTVSSPDHRRAVFISYAHKDNEAKDPKQRWLDRVLEFLQPLIRQEDLAVLSDKDLNIGDDWHATIRSQVNAAKAVVLLVSPAFLASKYIANSELPIVLRNARANGVAILPVIVSPSLYEHTRFKYPDAKNGPEEFTLASLQAANPPSHALNEMDEGEQNRVLEAVALRLKDLFSGAAQPVGTPTPDVGDTRDAEQRSNTVLFDEGHGQREWWTLSPTLASGYRRAKTITERAWKTSTAPTGRAFTAATLDGYKALILSIGPEKRTLLTDGEIAAVHGFVSSGGGLFVMGTYTGDWHHEANLNKLLQAYGIAFNRDVITKSVDDGFKQGSQLTAASKSAVEARPPEAVARGNHATLVAGVSAVGTLSSCSLYVNEDAAAALLETSSDSVILEPVPIGIGVRIQDYQARGRGPAIVAAAARGPKVVVVGSWKMFLDSFLEHKEHDNGKLFENIIGWLTARDRRQS